MGRYLIFPETVRHGDDVMVLLKIVIEGEKPLAFCIGHVVRDPDDASKQMWMTTTHRIGRNPDVVSKAHVDIADAAMTLLHAWVNSMDLHETETRRITDGIRVSAAPVSDWLASI